MEKVRERERDSNRERKRERLISFPLSTNAQLSPITCRGDHFAACWRARGSGRKGPMEEDNKASVPRHSSLTGLPAHDLYSTVHGKLYEYGPLLWGTSFLTMYTCCCSVCETTQHSTSSLLFSNLPLKKSSLLECCYCNAGLASRTCFLFYYLILLPPQLTEPFSFTEFSPILRQPMGVAGVLPGGLCVTPRGDGVVILSSRRGKQKDTKELGLASILSPKRTPGRYLAAHVEK